MDLPPNVKLEIQGTSYAFTAASSDKLAWAENLRGVSDLKSAHDLATDNKHIPFEGEWLWKIQTLPKIQFFLWKCLHNSIGVKSCLTARGVYLDPLCPLCNN